MKETTEADARASLHKHLDTFGLDGANKLLSALEEGRIDGHWYWEVNEQCGCVFGTMLIDRYDRTVEGSDLQIEAFVAENFRKPADPYVNFEPIEDYAMLIESGDTIETNNYARNMWDWVTEWVEDQRVDG
jgi:hypothetical protein